MRVQGCLNGLSDELGGAPIDQIALAWLLKHPSHIIPVLGTGKFERVQSAVKAAQIALTKQQWFKV